MRRALAGLLLAGVALVPGTGTAHNDDQATQIDGFVTICSDPNDQTTCENYGADGVTYYLVFDTIDPTAAQVWEETNDVPALQTHWHDANGEEVPAGDPNAVTAPDTKH